MITGNVNELPRTAEILRAQIEAGIQIGAQLYVSVRGRVMADLGIGQSRPGVAMTPDTVILWMSATKPMAALAIAQLWEKGLLTLDDPIAQHVPEFAQHEKDRITLRHILTHTAPIRWVETGWPDVSWDTIISKICSMRPERDWVPGQKAGYSALVSWFMLGEIVRRLDGRAFADYVRQEIFEPLGMNDSWIAMPPEVYRGYGDRLAITQKTETGHPIDAGLDTEPAATHARPASSGHGPVRELGRIYEMMLAGGTLQGRRIISPQTVEALIARHRAGMYDITFRHIIDWGLGFLLNSNQYGPDTLPYGYGPHASHRTFGHNGHQSATAFADPEHGLVVTLVCNGMPGEPAHHKRMREIHTIIYEELGLVY
ncbi:MAG TPA: serine hydrolase domain-containing protein [Tepidisphaeraceae bacterium]|jgi:CubicO group peptidase (beta-lactamase class C family)